MTVEVPEISETLRSARRAVDALPQFVLIKDLTWVRDIRKWTLCVELGSDDTSEHIPQQSRWWLHLDPRFPWGDIEIFPAKDGGIAGTFAHQDRNNEGEKREPWRTGDVCVRSPISALGREALDDDPLGCPTRLQWYLKRLTEWVSAAATGTLIKAGEPFELPQFKPALGVVGFIEGGETLQLWQNCQSRAGVVELAVLGADPIQLVAERFFANDQLLFEIAWGERVRQAKQRVQGFWLRSNGLPVVVPYQAVSTWGELRAVFKREGVSLDDLVRPTLEPLRESSPLFGMLGFPIPATHGGVTQQLHWQAFSMPAISSGEKFHPGFRKRHPRAYWMRDRASVLRDSASITWLHSENWSPRELSTRGQLPATIRKMTTTMIGAGSVGAPFAELLVRGGVYDIEVVDGDCYEMGNHVRHTLLMDDVERFKADRVTHRLNRVSPLVKAHAIRASFPDVKRDEAETIRSSQLVIDCTGSDDVSAALATFGFGSDTWFWSVSVSLGAKRVYVFTVKRSTFPLEQFHRLLRPWIKKDAAEREGKELPREGTGCWHPVFPASPEEVALMVAAAVRFASDVTTKGMVEPTLSVFERRTKDGLFDGVVRVDGTEE